MAMSSDICSATKPTGGDAGYLVGAGNRTHKVRKGCRRLKVDPAIPSKVNLHPTMRICATDHRLAQLRIEFTIRVTRHDSRRHTQFSSHDRHRRSKVVTKPSIVATEQKP